MRMRHLLLAAASMALAACSTGTPDEVVQGVAVYTQPGPNVGNLGPAPTYYLNNVVTIRQNGNAQAPGDLNNAIYAPVKSAIQAGMTAAGFTETTNQLTATVGVSLGIASATQDYYYSGGWCDIYYGWYGCYYPPVYAGSYTYGAGILSIVDLTAPPQTGQQFPNVWGAFIYGVSTGTTNVTRLSSGITRAFSQSPYLNQ